MSPSFRVLLPHWAEPSRAGQGRIAEVDFSDEDGNEAHEAQERRGMDCDFSDNEGGVDAQPEDDIVLAFDNMLLNPGTCHVTHNAANALHDCMPTYGHRTTENLLRPYSVEKTQAAFNSNVFQ